MVGINLDNVTLPELIEVEILQEIQDAFAEANEVASVITDLDGKPITQPSNFCDVCQIVRSTEKGLEKCMESDRILGERARKTMKPAYEKCKSCGFFDASTPIVVGDKHIANWLIGQTNAADVTEEDMIACAEEIGADKEQLLTAFHNMHQMDLEKFEKVLNLLWVIGKQISVRSYHNLQQKKEKENLESIVEKRTAELRQKMSLIEEQREAIIELSTPVIQIWDRILILPLVGMVDSKRAVQLMQNTLDAVTEHRAKQLIIDITGVPFVDTEVANHIIKTIQATKLVGAECMLVGISSEVAQTLVHIGADLNQMMTFATLQDGLQEALAQLKFEVIKHEHKKSWKDMI